MRRAKIANAIHIARDGEETLDFLLCQREHAERAFLARKLVLLDMKLPRVDGFDVLRAIRQDPRTELIPVVMLTSSKEQRGMIDSYKLHVNSYVQKPVDSEKFQHIVQQLGFYWLMVNQAA